MSFSNQQNPRDENLYPLDTKKEEIPPQFSSSMLDRILLQQPFDIITNKQEDSGIIPDTIQFDSSKNCDVSICDSTTTTCNSDFPDNDEFSSCHPSCVISLDDSASGLFDDESAFTTTSFYQHIREALQRGESFSKENQDESLGCERNIQDEILTRKFELCTIREDASIVSALSTMSKVLS